MFSQSLTKGSEQAQISLQRLTTFLETEGATGQISPQLLKKILGMQLINENINLLFADVLILYRFYVGFCRCFTCRPLRLSGRTS